MIGMRKTFTLFAFACLGLGLHAQFVRTDMGNLGDTQRYRKADTTGVAAGPSGTGQTWNFAGLNPTFAIGTNAYIAASAHPQGSNFPSADIALTLANGQFAFYESSADSLHMLGEKSPSNTLITYSDGGTWFRYPQAMGVPNVDSVYGEYPDGFISTVSRAGLLQTTYDGDGSLTTPFGTFPSVKRIEYLAVHHDSSWTGAAEVDVYITRYEWYAAGDPMPALIIHRQVVILNGGNPTVSKEVWYADDNATAVAPAIAGQFAISPNPSHGTTQLSYRLDGADDVTVEVLNVLGERVQSVCAGMQAAGSYHFEMGQHLPKGVYLVRMLSSKGATTQRMVLN